MNLTIIEGPRTTALTTLANVKDELNLSVPTYDARLTRWIRELSNTIYEYTNLFFARTHVQELLPGGGRLGLMVSRTPILQVNDIQYLMQSIPVSGYNGYQTYDADAGIIYRQPTWTVSLPIIQSITRVEVNDIGRLDWMVDYIGGYLLPGDDLTPSGICSAVASDNSFNLQNNDFPILISGDTITVTGFGQPANNGVFTVQSRTPGKVTVNKALANETPSGIVSIGCRTLPADLETACIEAVFERYYRTSHDPTIQQEKIGDWQASYNKVNLTGGLPDGVIARLQKWARVF